MLRLRKLCEEATGKGAIVCTCFRGHSEDCLNARLDRIEKLLDVAEAAEKEAEKHYVLDFDNMRQRCRCPLCAALDKLKGGK